MAVAVKHTPETFSSHLLERLPVAILAGLVYILGSLGIVFKLLPILWWSSFGFQDSAVAKTLLVLVSLAVVAGLGVLGVRLVGPKPMPGLRAGIFVALAGLLVVILGTRIFSIIIEHMAYDSRMFTPTVGIVLTSAVGLGLLILLGRYFLRPGTDKQLQRFEEQGWFSTTSYKRSQGLRVRRGTTLAILVMAACGVYSLLSHHTLDNSEGNWSVDIPFTGVVTVDEKSIGDAKVLPTLTDAALPVKLDRYELRDLNSRLLADYVKVKDAGDSELVPGEVIPRTQFDETRAQLEADKQEKRELPVSEKPVQATGSVQFATLTLIPDIKYTLPLLLISLSLWLAWRLVNVPVFADFLIATEAELNKVSWTTRRRLIQDTVVVLVTVVLLTIFLAGVDVLWIAILKSKPMGVLRFPDATTKSSEAQEQPW